MSDQPNRKVVVAVDGNVDAMLSMVSVADPQIADVFVVGNDCAEVYGRSLPHVTVLEGSHTELAVLGGTLQGRRIDHLLLAAPTTPPKRRLRKPSALEVVRHAVHESMHVSAKALDALAAQLSSDATVTFVVPGEAAGNEDLLLWVRSGVMTIHDNERRLAPELRVVAIVPEPLGASGRCWWNHVVLGAAERTVIERPDEYGTAESVFVPADEQPESPVFADEPASELPAPAWMAPPAPQELAPPFAPPAVDTAEPVTSDEPAELAAPDAPTGDPVEVPADEPLWSSQLEVALDDVDASPADDSDDLSGFDSVELPDVELPEIDVLDDIDLADTPAESDPADADADAEAGADLGADAGTGDVAEAPLSAATLIEAAELEAAEIRAQAVRSSENLLRSAAEAARAEEDRAAEVRAAADEYAAAKVAEADEYAARRNEELSETARAQEAELAELRAAADADIEARLAAADEAAAARVAAVEAALRERLEGLAGLL